MKPPYADLHNAVLANFVHDTYGMFSGCDDVTVMAVAFFADVNMIATTDENIGIVAGHLVGIQDGHTYGISYERYEESHA